jgi:FixJ family two-component response regulator
VSTTHAVRRNGPRMPVFCGIPGKMSARFADLAPREQEILWFVVTTHKFAAKDIADELGLSYRTVQKYFANISEKCGTHSLVETILVLFTLTVRT